MRLIHLNNLDAVKKQVSVLFAPPRREFFSATLNTVDAARGGVRAGIEQAPCLAIVLVLGFRRLGEERYAVFPASHVLWNDLPGVLLNYVGGKKVEGTGRIWFMAATHHRTSEDDHANGICPTTRKAGSSSAFGPIRNDKIN